MNKVDELIDTFQSELANLPSSFQEGDEVVAKVTPNISKLLNASNDMKIKIHDLLTQRANLKRGIKDLSDNIMVLATETTKPFGAEQRQKVSEAEQVRQMLEQTNGRSLF